MNSQDRLKALEFETQSIVLHCQMKFQKMGMLWSMGKDSTSLLWMVKKLFNHHIPFPLFHIDTSYKIPEMISFREELKEKWKLPLIVSSNQEAISNEMNPSKGKLNCCKSLKAEPLMKLIQEHELDCLLVGIRRDEENSRSKERFFSLRKNDGTWDYQNQSIEVCGLWPEKVALTQHFRVHPLVVLDRIGYLAVHSS